MVDRIPARRRKPVNLLVRTDLLQQARTAGVNLSSLLEWALERRLVARRREQWLESNAGAIALYNHGVVRNGVFRVRSLRSPPPMSSPQPPPLSQAQPLPDPLLFAVAQSADRDTAGIDFDD